MATNTDGTIGRSRWEVVVVGGGPAGAVAARTLARRGRTVVLVEATRYDGWRLGETLPPSIREPLTALDVGEAFDAMRKVPSNGIRRCWGNDEPRSRTFLANPYESGFHVDRTAFDRMLGLAARKAGATVLLGTRVSSCDPDSNDRTFTLSLDRTAASTETPPVASEDSEGITALAVLDATGRTARVARRLGADREVRDRLVGAGARFRADHHDCGRHTLIEATPDGWWYSAPLPGGRLVVVFFTDADLLGRRRDADPWRDALGATSETADRVASATFERGPNVASVLSHRLDRDLDNRPWIAVGDAAMGVDPLSGTGIERAIDTGVRGALAIDQWLDGEREQAETYQRALVEDFEAYLDHRATYYRQEDRWPERTFWHRRHDPATIDPP